MRTYRTNKGPLSERPHYSIQEIENLCADELRRFDLYPQNPEPIRIERFIEKRFKVHPEYLDLPDGLLGFTRFGSNGVEQIVVARTLAEKGTRIAERQMNSTLAHEAGHGLLQGHLFALEQDGLTSLFNENFDPQTTKILCRDPLRQDEARSGYGGRWWEFQANQAIGALLLPRSLALKAIADLVTAGGSLGQTILKPSQREGAVERLSEIFDVNPIVARIRLNQIFPEIETQQLLL